MLGAIGFIICGEGVGFSLGFFTEACKQNYKITIETFFQHIYIT